MENVVKTWSSLTDIPYGIYLSNVVPVSTPQDVFKIIIVMTFAVYIWETYLSLRQRSLCKRTTSVPTELAGVMDQVTFNKARAYHLDKMNFGLIHGAFEEVLHAILLFVSGYSLLWELSAKVTAYFGYGREHEITLTLVFTFLGSVMNLFIGLPFSIYETFVIEERHGFNKQTPGFYAKDKLKKFIVVQAIVLPLLAAIIHIVKIGGEYFFIYLWVFCVVVSLILVTVYADYIAPLFDKFTPLDDGELKNEIENLAQSINFPLKKIFIIEGSKRSAHSNAYLYGFYNNKRIVLFDTLLQEYSSKEKKEPNEDDDSKKSEVGEKVKRTGCTDDEILAILAHEFGHWKFSHVMKNIFIAQVNYFICFMVFSMLFKNKTLYQAFGFYRDQPVLIGLYIVFQYVFTPYNEAISFLMTYLSRRFEFQADFYAKMLNKAADLRSALIKINKDNLSFPVYDWLYSSWNHSHPPLLQRLKALGKIE